MNLTPVQTIDDSTEYAEPQVIHREFSIRVSKQLSPQHIDTSIPGTSNASSEACIVSSEVLWTPTKVFSTLNNFTEAPKTQLRGSSTFAGIQVASINPRDPWQDHSYFCYNSPVPIPEVYARAEATFPRRSQGVCKARMIRPCVPIGKCKPKRIGTFKMTCSEEGTPHCKRRQRFFNDEPVRTCQATSQDEPSYIINSLTAELQYHKSLASFYKNTSADAGMEREQAEAKCRILASEVKKKDDDLKRLHSEIVELKNLNRNLFEKLASIETEKMKMQEGQLVTVHKILQPYFSDGQIRCIIEGHQWVKWTIDDYASAISLRSVSPKAYRYLRNKLNYLLPSLSSLRRWALSKFDISEGFLSDVLTVMKAKGIDFTPMEKIVVLTFDEMALTHEIAFDAKLEQVIGPCGKVQVIMARGLFSNWKQPLYYKFDQPMRKSILLEALSLLHEADYQVVAVTCDMGNRGVWGELGITPSKHFFSHPTIKDAPVFVFADIPHLLKLLRNWFFDDGFVVAGCDEKFTVAALQTIVDHSADGDLCTAYKLTQRILDARHSLRQAVWPAARVWSRTVGIAVKWAGDNGLLGTIQYKQLSDFILAVNAWFDVHNSQNQFGAHSGVNAYGVDVEKQDSSLALMTSLILNTRVGKRKTLMPFQEGILVSNASLRGLHDFLAKQFPHDFKYIITRRLQQDILENFFSYIRGMGASRDHPSAYDFRYRLRWYVLGKHSHAIFTNNRNSEEDMSASCISSKSLQTFKSTSDRTCRNVLDVPSTPSTGYTNQSHLTLDQRDFFSSTPFSGIDAKQSFSGSCAVDATDIINSSMDPNFRHEPDPSDLRILTEELFADIVNMSPNAISADVDNDQHVDNSDTFSQNHCDADEAAKLQYVGVGTVTYPIPIGCLSASDIMQEAGLQYIAGYVAYRFKTKYRFLGEPTSNIEGSLHAEEPDWIHAISRGKLMIPSKDLYALARITEDCFIKFHGNKLSKEQMVIQKVVQLVKATNIDMNCIPNEVLQCLVRTRTYIRVREINKKLYAENEKRKLLKKNKKLPKMMKSTIDSIARQY